MPVRILRGNVLDASADALILTMDGVRRGMGGTVAHAFARRWPEAFDEIEDQIAYPVPLGRTVATWPTSECAFPLVLMAATLHHLGMLPDSQKAGVVASALGEALSLAVQHRRYTIATAVMTGGWRLPLARALGTMLDASQFLAREDAAVLLVIHVLDDEAVARVVAASRGFALGGGAVPQ
jgi:O-acetyl-ADP-ribose deacetylase (regulator of RNase III)